MHLGVYAERLCELLLILAREYFLSHFKHPLIPGTSLKLQENLPARVIETAILYAPVLPRGRESEFEAWDLVSRVSHSWVKPICLQRFSSVSNATLRSV